MALSRRQQHVLGFLVWYIATNGYSPTIREVAEHFEFTVSAATAHLNALRRKGSITWLSNAARTIRVIDKRTVHKIQDCGN
jgi:repressor LexA